jgi:hypothetical protein
LPGQSCKERKHISLQVSISHARRSISWLGQDLCTMNVLLLSGLRTSRGWLWRWDVTSCSPVDSHWSVGGMYYLHLQGGRVSSARARDKQSRLMLRALRGCGLTGKHQPLTAVRIRVADKRNSSQTLRLMTLSRVLE